MADNYCQSSSMIPLPPGSEKKAKRVIDAVCKSIDGTEGYVGFEVHIEEAGVWIKSEEGFNADHAERLVKRLVDKLKIPGIHVCSWAYTCSKPRVGEFGGGAFAVQMNLDTVWIDAASEAEKQAGGLL